MSDRICNEHGVIDGKPWQCDRPARKGRKHCHGHGSQRRRGKEPCPLRPAHAPRPIIYRNGIPGKVCRECEQWKPFADLMMSRSHPGGVDAICRKCDAKRVAAYDASEAGRARDRRYNGSDTRRQRDARRRAKEANAFICDVSYGQAAARQKAHSKHPTGEFCFFCRRPLTQKTAHLEHYRAIEQRGQTELANMVLSCGPCNSSKCDKVLYGDTGNPKYVIGLSWILERRKLWLLESDPSHPALADDA